MHRRLSYRRDARLEGSFAAELVTEAGPRPAVCRNLSRGGAFLEGVDLPVGTELNVRITLSSTDAVACLAQVVYRSEGDGAGLGLRFLDLPSDAQHRVRAFVEQLRPVEEPLAAASSGTGDVVTM